MTFFKLPLMLSFIFVPCVLSFSLNHANTRFSALTLGNIVRPSLTLFETAQNVEILIPAESNTDVEKSSRISVSRPEIHWTVPGFKVGWRDESGNWFDEDGLRNGPPLNYWRQVSDQQDHDRDMEALNMALTEYNLEETVQNLEKRRSTRLPSLHRKMLGRWAPIISSGERVTFNDKAADNEASIDVPYTIEISRTNGRKYAPKNHYGIFDLRLSVGEQLTVNVVTQKDVIISANLLVDDANEPVILGMLDEDKPLYFGGFTYLTDYIMIQRNPDGKVDLLLRVDDSYFGVKDSSIAMGEIKVEEVK